MSSPATIAVAGDEVGEDGEGVLLYYKYTAVDDVGALVSFYRHDCSSLGLLGRVRIAPGGVNVTIGGRMSCLKQHIARLSSMSLFNVTDFKLAASDQARDQRIAKECGFTSLSIRVVKEVVTFSSNPLLKPPDISEAGRHLSANEFHSVLHAAGSILKDQLYAQIGQPILLDARNVYETRIGKFETPNVETLDPEIRQYSDLPSWIDKNSEKLRGKHILMYCTGGIRCELASSYIRSKGSGYENVFQLYGGIQRYLEQFPDGGYFKGKNFVFDHRISVGAQNEDIRGACLLCGSSFDDYSSRCRCTHCRMLVLVCHRCQTECRSNVGYVCELCQKHDKREKVVEEDAELEVEVNSESSGTIEIESVPSNSFAMLSHDLLRRHGNNPFRKLRILCLHGFRQNASNFKGRTSSLAKKLKGIAEFVFVDAPHELALIYRPRSADEPSEKSTYPINLPQQDKHKKRFSWLIDPNSAYFDCQGCKVLDEPFAPLQYLGQTDGLEVSCKYLDAIFSERGPFDGILGFSQGAAMTALFSERRLRQCHAPGFRFVILCSGFSLLLGGIKGSIKCPSMHIFGSDQGVDRQISCKASRDLASLFDEGTRVIIEHDMGHIIPTRTPYIDQMKDFLCRFI